MMMGHMRGGWPARVALAAASLVLLWWLAGHALGRIAVAEAERRDCGCAPAAPPERCPPACARHAWWWNIQG